LPLLKFQPSYFLGIFAGNLEEPQLSQYPKGHSTRNVTEYVRRVIAWAKFQSLFNNIWYHRVECNTDIKQYC